MVSHRLRLISLVALCCLESLDFQGQDLSHEVLIGL